MSIYILKKGGKEINRIIADAESIKIIDKTSYDSFVIEEEPSPIIIPPIVSTGVFKQLFTATERIAIKTERVTDPIIEDFYDTIEDLTITTVDLNAQSTKDYLAHLETVGLIEEIRITQILKGTPL